MFLSQRASVVRRDLTEVRINEDGLSSGDAGHGLQVTVMPVVSLHIVVRYEGFANLCQPNDPNHLHLVFHLHKSIATVC